MKVYGAYIHNELFEGFFSKKSQKSRKSQKSKKVYTSDGTNASDLITRVFFITLVKIKNFKLKLK
jgi:hypothetical protein